METTYHPPEDDDDEPGEIEVPDEAFLSAADAADDDTVDDAERDEAD